MQKSIGIELLERVAASQPIAHKLRAVQGAQWPVQFSHVIQAAQPFVAAIIAHTWFRLRADDRQTADSTIWILCPSVHSQESFYESLVNWQSDALFLPEAEFAAAENVLPDPEIVAERLAVLMQIGRGTGPRPICIRTASRSATISGSGKTFSAAANSASGRNSASDCQLTKLS